MNPKNISRREVLAGAAALAATGLAPRAEAQANAAWTPSNRAAWMQDPRYCWGVMTHYLSDWQANVHKLTMTPELWNKMIDGWDVEGMAARLASVGAGHYQISIGQNSGYYLSPNTVYDKLTGISPTKCSRRDLVADLYAPLHRRDIKLMVYLPAGAPGEDKAAMTALEWQNGAHPNTNFQRRWEQIIAEWSRRWGTHVCGWWFDGCYFANAMYRSPAPPNFTSFAAAARAGNPNSALAFNPGVTYRIEYSQCREEDYSSGEVDKPELANPRHVENGRTDTIQVHMLSYLGTHWGMGTPRFSTEQVIGYTKKIRDLSGSVTWDVPVELDGTITQPFLDQLAALGKAFPRTL